MRKGNLSTLDDLLQSRASLAQLLGFSSFSHMALASNRMAQTPEQIKSFLEEISCQLKQKARQELDLLSEEKRRLNPLDHKIYAWDKSFYIQRVRQR